MTWNDIGRMTLVLALAAMLGACGRKGDLEAPGAEPVATQNGTTAKPAVEDRPFILDPLL